MGGEDFVFEFATFEENAFTVDRGYVLGVTGVMDAKFPAVAFRPFGIQVHDHRVLSAGIVAELVEVFFVKTSCRVQCVMKFVAGYSGVASGVQVQYKTVHEVEKFVFVYVIMFAVEPVDHVAAVQLVVYYQGIISGPSGQEQVLGKKR